MKGVWEAEMTGNHYYGFDPDTECRRVGIGGPNRSVIRFGIFENGTSNVLPRKVSLCKEGIPKAGTREMGPLHIRPLQNRPVEVRVIEAAILAVRVVKPSV